LLVDIPNRRGDEPGTPPWKAALPTQEFPQSLIRSFPSIPSIFRGIFMPPLLTVRILGIEDGLRPLDLKSERCEEKFPDEFEGAQIACG